MSANPAWVGGCDTTRIMKAGVAVVYDATGLP